MDKDTRHAVGRATQRARKLLEDDLLLQLEGTFDVMRVGAVAAKGGAHLSAPQVSQRDKIVAAIEHKRSAGMTAVEAVTDYVRDTAFTTLNRFVALKMLEARQLVQECITKGERSAGYREFCGMAPGVALLPDEAGYRLYIECVFDELSTEIKVLFDRRDSASVLWPKRQTFDALLAILNAQELAGVWEEDETIGWVYQFFNSGDERKRMRKESQAPRNSRELAVRNQFFTPRYVVEFLVDNTLGRTWLEMYDEGSALTERCRYFVQSEAEQARTRPRKDPRDMRILDPACGSGHFLLYCFDLLLIIYEEAWGAEGSGVHRRATGRTLRDDYPDLANLRCATPALILEHNLHGVDIDPRATQIAALALWLRAQRAWKDVGVPATERPRVRRTHVVVAEPMPGDTALVEQFAARLDPPLLRDLFRMMVSEMRLAGELGTLIPVEEGIAAELRRAREQFVKQRQTMGILPGMGPVRKQGELDISGIDDDSFFHEAEARIVEALRQFAEAAAGGGSVRRRLFAGDTAQGIALIDLLRTRFDVVLMNPPFGDGVPRAAEVLRTHYGDSANDLFAAFVHRGLELRAQEGLLGCITSRTGFFVPSLKRWRQAVYGAGLSLVADLGQGVMDDATVEAAAYCIGFAASGLVFRLLLDKSKGEALLGAIARIARSGSAPSVYRPDPSSIGLLPDAPFAYWVSRDTVAKLASRASFEPNRGAVRKGLRTGDNFRFVRAYWEVSSRRICTTGTHPDMADGWVPLVMTGASQPWFAPIFLVLNWASGGKELRAYVLKYGAESRLIQAKDFYFKPGFSWTRRAVRLFPYAIPPGCIFTGSRPMAFPSDPADAPATVGLFASRVASAFLRFYAEWFSRPNFLEGKLKVLPVPDGNDALRDELSLAFSEGVKRAREIYTKYEPFLEFVAPAMDLSLEPDTLSFDRARLLPDSAEQLVQKAYGLSEEEAERLELDLTEALVLAASPQGAIVESQVDDEDDDDDSVVLLDNPEERARRLISYAVGCLFGRWDIRMALGELLPPTRAADQPLRPTPAGYRAEHSDVVNLAGNYPFEVWKDGIAVDDEGQPRDIVAAVRRTLTTLRLDINDVMGALDATEAGLRSELALEFWRWHIRTYSLGRRKAPIFWKLGTASAGYSVWLYFHAFNRDTLFTVQTEYALPKLAFEVRRLEDLRREYGASPKAGERRQIVTQESFVEELRVFVDDLKRVAPLWRPDLDDGVIINFAPLWRLVSHHKPWQKDLKATWDALCAGKYDWARLAMHLWPERVVPKCATDRSLAIAHGLEEAFWLEGTDGKWKARSSATRPTDELVRERTSPAVKEALKSLLEAPAGGGGNGPGRRRRVTTAPSE